MSTTGATELAEYRQRMSQDPDGTFGDLVWFTIRNASVKWVDLQQWFVELGLDERYLPNEVLPVDAFDAATGAKMKYEYSLGPDRTAILMCRDAGRDQQSVHRQITREVKFKRRKELGYTKVGEAVFYRQPRSSKAKGLPGGERVRFSITKSPDLAPHEEEEVSAFIRKIHETYEDRKVYLHTDAIRGVVREYIKGLNAVLLNTKGGLYFVHKSRRGEVRALRELVDRVNQESRLDDIPLPDDPRRRELVTDAFQEEVSKQCDALLAKVAAINERTHGGAVPATKYAEINRLYTDAQERAEEYTKLLGIAQGKAGAALELAFEALMDLSTRIAPGDAK